MDSLYTMLHNHVSRRYLETPCLVFRLSFQILPYTQGTLSLQVPTLTRGKGLLVLNSLKGTDGQ